MKLSDYLARHDEADANFAKRIGKDRTTVSRLRRTNQCPSRATVNAIARATDGQVTADDFWLEEQSAA